jgi:hypothetical protein
MPVDQARYDLEQRGCAQAAVALDNQLEAAAHTQRPYAEFLAELWRRAIAGRRARFLRPRTRLAHLPAVRTLAPYAFRFQPHSADIYDVRHAPGTPGSEERIRHGVVCVADGVGSGPCFKMQPSDLPDTAI